MKSVERARDINSACRREGEVRRRSGQGTADYLDKEVVREKGKPRPHVPPPGRAHVALDRAPGVTTHGAGWTTRVTAFALTRRDRQWLMLQQRRLDVICWELPGGHVENGETLEDCAARETLEETGIEVLVGRLIATCVHEWPERRERRLVCFFEATSRSGETPTLTPAEDQILTVTWLDPMSLHEDDVSAFLLPLLDNERTGWSEGPIHYRATHARLKDGSLRPVLQR